MPSRFLEIYEGAVKAFKEVGDIYESVAMNEYHSL